MMSNYATARGVETLVADGAIRDVEELAALDLAVVARGARPSQPFRSSREKPASASLAAGSALRAGDLPIGDQDGVLVVPRREAEDILGLAEDQFKPCPSSQLTGLSLSRGSARLAIQNQRGSQPRRDCLNGVYVMRNRPQIAASTSSC